MSITEAFPQRSLLGNVLFPGEKNNVWSRVYEELNTFVGYLAVIHSNESFSSCDPEKTAELLKTSKFLVPCGVVAVIGVHNPFGRRRAAKEKDNFVAELGRRLGSDSRGVATGSFGRFERVVSESYFRRKSIVDIAGITRQTEPVMRGRPGALQQIIVATSQNPNHNPSDGLPYIETLRFISKEPGSDLWLPITHD